MAAVATMWRAKPEIGWRFKWISSGRTHPECLAEWIGGSYLLYLRAQGSTFPTTERPFSSRRREERLVPFPLCPTSRRAVFRPGKPCSRYTKNPRGTHYFRSPARSPRPKCSRPLCQLVTWVPVDAKETSESPPLSLPHFSLGIDRDRDPAFFHTGMSPSRMAFLLFVFNIALIDGR